MTKAKNIAPKIICLSCKEQITFEGDIDFNKFKGEVCCDKCGTLLEINIVNQKLQGQKVMKKGFRDPDPEAIRKIYEALKKEEEKHL
jgi:hypothetical protein